MEGNYFLAAINTVQSSSSAVHGEARHVTEREQVLQSLGSLQLLRHRLHHHFLTDLQQLRRDAQVSVLQQGSLLRWVPTGFSLLFAVMAGRRCFTVAGSRSRYRLLRAGPDAAAVFVCCCCCCIMDASGLEGSSLDRCNTAFQKKKSPKVSPQRRCNQSHLKRETNVLPTSFAKYPPRACITALAHI